MPFSSQTVLEHPPLLLQSPPLVHWQLQNVSPYAFTHLHVDPELAPHALPLSWLQSAPLLKVDWAHTPVPMSAELSLVHCVPWLLAGGGSQMLVLAASAWQTVWLSVAATRRFMGMRIERDRALVAEAAAQEQARRDPLTGLRNRRGFTDAITPLLDRVTQEADGVLDDSQGVALLLLDVDRFKAINDAHGHDAGDVVLVTLARRLARWDGAMCVRSLPCSPLAWAALPRCNWPKACARG